MRENQAMSNETIDDLYESVHQQIGREEALINNRLTWLLVFHGLLFNVIAQNAGAPLDAKLVGVLLHGIPLVGFCTAILGFAGVCAAYISIRGVRASWERVPAGIRELRVRPYGGTWTHRFGMSPSIGIPLVLAAAWVIIWIWI